MKKSIVLFSVCLLSLLTNKAFADGYVGNAFGVEGYYRIFEFLDDGRPWRPVSGTTFAAWPTAVASGNVTTVYGSEYVNGKWVNVRRWTSTNGAAYVDNGVVLSANASEPYGIGPTTIAYDGTQYRFYYLIRGATGPGNTIGMATSTDGVNFSRVGVVYTAGSEAPSGVAVSYVCQDGSTSYMYLEGYGATTATATGIVASASTLDGPFTGGQSVFPNTNVTGTISGVAGNSFAQFTGTISLNRALVVNGSPSSVYLPQRINGNTVFLDRPLVATYSSTPMGDFLRQKAEISFVRKMPDGSWTGGATGYGSFTGLTSEYTTPLSAPSPNGPWSITGGYFLNPYFNSGQNSTENPEPIRSSASCSE